MFTRLKPHLGLIILVVVFAAALLRIFALQSKVIVIQKKVIKLCHWQLEAGVREGIDAVAREYMKLHPEIEVEQIPIGERGYGSWITTRLIGGTAPDLIEMGMIDPTLANQLWLRYFVPLSDEILKPNPYNRGTPLEGVPWKDTYYDDMVGGFVPDLLDYYQVPGSGFTIRIFYNKKRFKEATGLDAPPRAFRDFLKACDRIKAYGQQRGERLVPIAGAGKYNASIMFGRFDQVVATTLLEETDCNYDGETTRQESAIALVSGRVDFHDPRLRASFKGCEYYMAQFQPAFFPADRMDAAFLFIQQKALMIASGSWDACSYVKQADFEIGICDFPIPDRDDPEFGRFVLGPVAEEMQGGFSFSLNRCGPHVDIALDFLKFFTSQRVNALFNRIARWTPMIRGNVPDAFMEPFWPHLDGVTTGIQLDVGPQNGTLMGELSNLHATGRLGFDDFMKRYASRFVPNADTYMKLDLPRDARIAYGQNEFRQTLERSLGILSGKGTDKTLVVLEGQIADRHRNTEYFQRYDEARANTKLPTE